MVQPGVSRTNRKKQQLRHKRVKENTPCGYCFINWATGYDHIIPWSFGGDEAPKNLYPCCKRCNCLLSSLVFDSLDDKRFYVWCKLNGKDYYEQRKNQVPGLPERNRKESSPQEVLQLRVQVAGLAKSANKEGKKRGPERKIRPKLNSNFVRPKISTDITVLKKKKCRGKERRKLALENWEFKIENRP